MHFVKCLSVLFILTESYLLIVLYMLNVYVTDSDWSRCPSVATAGLHLALKKRGEV